MTKNGVRASSKEKCFSKNANNMHRPGQGMHDHMNKWDDCAQIVGKTGCRYRGGQWSRRRFCARTTTVFRFVCLKSTPGVSDEDKLFTTF